MSRFGRAEFLDFLIPCLFSKTTYGKPTTRSAGAVILDTGRAVVVLLLNAMKY